MADLAVGAPYASLKFEGLAGADRHFQYLADRGPVLGDILLDAVIHIDRRARRQPVDAIGLVGPVDRPADQVDAPMPDERRRPGLAKPAVPLLQPPDRTSGV